LGITLLRASNLGDPHATDNENLNECGRNYSSAWVTFLKDVLNKNPNQRPDCL